MEVAGFGVGGLALRVFVLGKARTEAVSLMALCTLESVLAGGGTLGSFLAGGGTSGSFLTGGGVKLKRVLSLLVVGVAQLRNLTLSGREPG